MFKRAKMKMIALILIKFCFCLENTENLFICDNNSKYIDLSKVNDDVCDCEDGSDENCNFAFNYF